MPKKGKVGFDKGTGRYFVSDTDLAMAADIDIQTVGKYREAAVVERRRAVFDRVVTEIRIEHGNKGKV